MKKLLPFLLMVPTVAGAQEARGWSQIWVGVQSVSKTAADRVTKQMIRLQAGVDVGRWTLSGRVEASGLPGKFSNTNPETYQAGKVGAAVNWNPFYISGASCGPVVAAEYGTILETKEGETARTPRPFSFLGGVQCRYRGTSVISGFGKSQSLFSSIANITDVQVPIAEVKAGSLQADTAFQGTFHLGERQESLVALAFVAKFGAQR